MSKPSSRLRWILACGLAIGWLAAGLSCARRAGPEIRWVPIPGGTNTLGSRAGRVGEQPRVVVVAGFRMSQAEVTVGQYLEYLNESGVACASPQVVQRDGVWRAAVPPDEPMSHVTQADALAFAAWVGARSGFRVRLPTADEWEYAARGGVDGAPYPWGWASPGARAHFKAERPSRVAQFAPSRWRLYDVVGNVAEWTADPNLACGGSWADRSADSLHVYRRITLPTVYRDADLGFRLLRE